MFKSILNFLCGALVAAAVSAAFAVTGQPPVNGFQAVDGTWLLGLASGQNYSYQSGITAHAGGTQAACLPLSAGIALYQIDAVASTNDSVCAPFAVAGTTFALRNAGAQTLNMYALSTNNALTAATDTINGSSNATAYSLAANNNVDCFAAKNGIWSCVKGN